MDGPIETSVQLRLYTAHRAFLNITNVKSKQLKT